MRMHPLAPLVAPLALLVVACSSSCSGGSAPPRPTSTGPSAPGARTAPEGDGTARAPAPPEGLAEALFAGGCFWCMEHPFERLEGVGEVLSGYTGGEEEAPTYHEVSYGRTGHYEAVRVLYDPTKVRFEELLEVFLHNIDPTQEDGQFCDRGDQYRSAIFVHDAAEREAARAALARAAETLGRPVVTTILPAGPFWIAEAYHQDFYRTHPGHYRRYRAGCGRDARLRALWGDAAGH